MGVTLGEDLSLLAEESCERRALLLPVSEQSTLEMEEWLAFEEGSRQHTAASTSPSYTEPLSACTV